MAPNLDMIVDVVDNKNQVISKVERRALFEEHLNFRTVHVLLFDRADRLVLQQLSPSHPRSPNRLGSSVAGYLQAEETYLHAAKRKLRKELRATARLKDAGQFEMLDESSRKFVGVYIGHTRGHLEIGDDQISELLYIPRSEVDLLVNNEPQLFTPTFLFVYEHFKRWTETSGR